MVRFNLLNTPVNSQTMVFMHHVIPDRKCRKALDFLTFIGTVPLLFLFFRTKNICLGNHRKLQNGILISLVYLAVAHHNLSRQQLMVIVICIETIQTFI